MLTVWLCGPRAVEVLAARYQQATEQSPRVDLDRVGFVREPEWLTGALMVAVARDLGAWLQDGIPILDEVRCRRLREDVEKSSWVRGVELERVFPDRFRLALDLRRPVLAVRDGDGAPLCLVDRDGIALHWVDTPLPAMRLHREGGSPSMRFAVGRVCEEPRVVAAAAIAVEWRDALAPLVPNCPTLLEIDTTNLDERWMRGRSYPEVRVMLRRDDGATVIFGYGRPVGSSLPRVAVASKALVLAKILGRHAGLQGLVAGDLRFKNRWADYLQPRAAGVPDPDGPWSQLESGVTRSGGR